jgi:hypothetical protein
MEDDAVLEEAPARSSASSWWNRTLVGLELALAVSWFFLAGYDTGRYAWLAITAMLGIEAVRYWLVATRSPQGVIYTHLGLRVMLVLVSTYWLF